MYTLLSLLMAILMGLTAYLMANDDKDGAIYSALVTAMCIIFTIAVSISVDL